MINNGVISIGDNNKITINNELNYGLLVQELEILEKESSDENVYIALLAAKDKNKKGFISAIKKISKKTINLIEKLGLNALTEIINIYLNKIL